MSTPTHTPLPQPRDSHGQSSRLPCCVCARTPLGHNAAAEGLQVLAEHMAMPDPASGISGDLMKMVPVHTGNGLDLLVPGHSLWPPPLDCVNQVSLLQLTVTPWNRHGGRYSSRGLWGGKGLKQEGNTGGSRG